MTPTPDVKITASQGVPMTHPPDQVKRYDATPARSDEAWLVTMEARPSGQYVLYSDYAALLAERDAMRESVAELKRLGVESHKRAVLAEDEVRDLRCYQAKCARLANFVTALFNDKVSMGDFKQSVDELVKWSA